MKAFKEEYELIKAELSNSKLHTVLKETRSGLNSRPLILYGASLLGKAILDTCYYLNMKVVCFCDQHVTGNFEGLEVISPDVLHRNYPNGVVVVCSYNYNDEICDTLKKLGFSKDQIIPCPQKHFFFSTPGLFKTHLAGYEWAYNYFEDEISKTLILDRIRLILLDMPLVSNTNCELYYEDGLITLSAEKEIFVDGGAYVGDSAKSFIRRMSATGGKYHIYSFEPEKENVNKIVSLLSSDPNVTVVQKGLWSTEANLRFTLLGETNDAGAFNTNIRGQMEQLLPVTSLDYYFEGKADSELPTFIKMDIEGSEREALLGCGEIIKRTKPKLAICAYHKPEDIYELPQTILSIRDDYRFALRQHFDGSFDTVLYAV